jgi:hypothetical protein
VTVHDVCGLVAVVVGGLVVGDAVVELEVVVTVGDCVVDAVVAVGDAVVTEEVALVPEGADTAVVDGTSAISADAGPSLVGTNISPVTTNTMTIAQTAAAAVPSENPISWIAISRIGLKNSRPARVSKMPPMMVSPRLLSPPRVSITPTNRRT